MSSPIWAARAALFLGQSTPTNMIELCPQRLHNMLRTGFYIFNNKSNGKRYASKRCKLCALEAVKRCREKKRAA